MDNTSKENEVEEKSLHDLKEEFVEVYASQDTEDLHIATAIENDEDDEVVEKPEVDDLISDKPEIGDLQYTDGKERDEVDFAEEQEKIYGVDTVSPFKTADVRVFRRKLETMSRDAMTALASRVAARTYSSEEDQKKELLKAFHSWSSTSGYVQTDSVKKLEKGALSEAFEGANSASVLRQKLKEKTLSDLQSTAARLGFNPSYDRDRTIRVIIDEYRRQS